MLSLLHTHQKELYSLSTAHHLRFITNHEYQEGIEELQIFFEKRVDRALYPNQD